MKRRPIPDGLGNEFAASGLQGLVEWDSFSGEWVCNHYQNNKIQDDRFNEAVREMNKYINNKRCGDGS